MKTVATNFTSGQACPSGAKQRLKGTIPKGSPSHPQDRTLGAGKALQEVVLLGIRERGKGSDPYSPL